MALAPMIVGNWKMYKTRKEAEDFVRSLASLIGPVSRQVFIAVPFTAIQTASEASKGTSIVIGAQNMHDEEEGAFTGEVSVKMLQDAGARFVILGHSERRHIFHEDNAFIHRKVMRAIKHKLNPILCVGETQEERVMGKTHEVLLRQLEEGFKGIKGEEFVNVTIAYEPVWAIGTGKTATPQMAQEAHAICRGFLQKRGAPHVNILYGGSVKPETIRDLLAQPDIDGALVGGASLDVQTFANTIL